MSTQNPTTVLIRYMDGQNKGQTEKFTVTPTLNITIGRGDANLIAFDPANDIISRQHCHIRVNPQVPDTYEITDLQSKNGTYVNGQVITGTTALIAGDTIRLGKEGPLLAFNLDPKPVSHIKKTRVVDAVDGSSKETKLHQAAPAAANTALPKETIGKQTMLHMIAQSEKKSRKGVLVAIAALLILMGTAGWLVYSNRSASQVIHIAGANTDSSGSARSLSAAQINKANETKVVSIELGWKLELTNTGEQLYHVYLPQKTQQGTMYMAAYVTNNTGATEPWLSTQSASPQGADLRPIGGFGTGTGFVVDERGFIMTNRHVATPWLTSYQFSPDAFPGLLIGMNEKGELAVNEKVSISQEQVSNWVPAEAMNYNRQLIQAGVKMIDGRSAYLDVTFANNSLRTPAKVVRISNVHDVAMIKIELPETLTQVEMFDNYNEIEPGSPVVVMGYPGMSPDQFVANRSQDAFNRNPNIVKVPVPTVSTGNIGRLVKGSSSGNKIDEYLSVMGDYYQLTINSTGPGNSGGPMFDEQGRVIGIYSAGNSTMSYSIPIKYAIELMGRQEVIR
ncbi:trypsin-like peptidase domain-containing protein [Agriterribacter sp.]|uniref:trypsin-like peptidase domain-containing protein n=1 Tax=Agriterribacter sp. TaxID=2821509 RepID=UPI002C0B72D5|nr:trypsin-like peptidase domain-containing protein [Agriterribacter sp.]HRO47927.1 trypsin-like peptidase domain-containing protein [Agriterribacter sp.]HRQ19107.1 trypsin-like peptidase domain-containing protein [Agriterribacter sp.]